MELNIFIYLGLMFAAAYAVKALSNRIGIPEVSGYVILGVILGISVTKFLGQDILDALEPVSKVALAIIAFVIGVELKLEHIKKLGKSIIWIVLMEGLGAFTMIFVFVNLFFPGSLARALLLGAVGAATAPAATVAVIRQYKSKGPLTSTILAVVGIDDALALTLYVVVSAFVKVMLLGGEIHIGTTVLTAIASIAMSLGVGLAMAIPYVFILRKVRSPEWIAMLLASALLLMQGITEMIGVSQLLAIMLFGAVVANAQPALSKRSESVVEGFSPIFLAAFFILGGAHLDVTVLLQIGLIGLTYFGARALGKIGFASIGAVIGGAEKKVRGGIGLALLPQVGVALALALSVKNDFANDTFGQAGYEIASLVINVLLFTTILTEIIGPLMTRWVLTRSGETNAERQ